MNIKTSTIIKMAIFNVVLAITCILLFSPGYLGLLPTAFTSTKRMLFYVIFVLIIILFVGVNYFFLVGPKKKVKFVEDTELKAPKDYIKKLQELQFKKEYEKPI